MFNELAIKGRLKKEKTVISKRNIQGLKLLHATMIVIVGADLDSRNAVETALWRPGTRMAVLRASA